MGFLYYLFAELSTHFISLFIHKPYLLHIGLSTRIRPLITHFISLFVYS